MSNANEYFTIREEDGLRLIIPAHSAAVGNAAWTPTNIWWRSRVETTQGDLVSQGFGKFFNLGCGPSGLSVGLDDVARAIEKGDAVATLKLDGSLLIRSVYNGKVYLRTRGSFRYEHVDNASEVVDVFAYAHPKLFDPTFMPNHSLLFEWVSPLNVIVIRYPEPTLTLIGAVDHRSMKYARVEELKTIGAIAGVPVMKHFVLTTQGWADLYADLEKNKEIEGYVIRLHGEQTLVKVKCAHYLTKHALKSKLDSETLADMYFQYGRPDFSEFVRLFGEAFDEETAMWAMPVISTLYDGVRELKKIEEHIRQKVSAAQASDAAKEAAGKPWEQEAIRRQNRKEFAIAMQQAYGSTKKFAFAMSLYLGETGKHEKHLKSVLLQNTKQMEISFLKAGRDDIEPDDMEA